MNNKKTILPILLVLVIVAFISGYLLGKGSNQPQNERVDNPITIVTPTTDPTNQGNGNENQVKEDGQYNTKEEVRESLSC